MVIGDVGAVHCRSSEQDKDRSTILLAPVGTHIYVGSWQHNRNKFVKYLIIGNLPVIGSNLFDVKNNANFDKLSKNLNRFTTIRTNFCKFRMKNHYFLTGKMTEIYLNQFPII
jgi:hypothetical protein